MVNSYPFELPIHTRWQHDAGNDGAYQHYKGIDDPGHRGVSDAPTAATHQARNTAAQARHLEDQ